MNVIESKLQVHVGKKAGETGYHMKTIYFLQASMFCYTYTSNKEEVCMKKIHSQQ